MKWLIASDIHGSSFYCKKLLERFDAENAERLILLGDILYHGPRNDLPRGYDPKEVMKMLSEYSEKILCVRGNCEAEVDQMVLNFPVMADYAVFCFKNKIIYATHGHKFGKENPPPLKKGDIMLFGHTHIPECSESGGNVFLNPGSVSIPKGGSETGYMTFEDGKFFWKNIKGEVFLKY